MRECGVVAAWWVVLGLDDGMVVVPRVRYWVHTEKYDRCQSVRCTERSKLRE